MEGPQQSRERRVPQNGRDPFLGSNARQNDHYCDYYLRH